MSYIEKSIQKNEKLIKKAEISKIALLPPIIEIIIGILLIIIVLITANEDYGIFMVLLSFALFIRSILEIIRVIIYLISSELAFTDKRVLSKKGLFKIQTIDSPIDKINDFHIKQTFFGRIFNYSTINIKTSSSVYYLLYVKDANAFKNLLTTTDKVQKVEMVNTKEENSSKYDELAKLKELLDNEVITKEEFAKEKEKLLNK